MLVRHLRQSLWAAKREPPNRVESAFRLPLRFASALRFKPELDPEMPEALRVHGAAIEHELPERREPRFGEEGAWPAVGGPQLDETALQHGLHRGRDLRLVPSLPATPGAQENAVRDLRVLAEVAAQLAAEQLALGGGERGGRAFGAMAHESFCSDEACHHAPGFGTGIRRVPYPRGWLTLPCSPRRRAGQPPDRLVAIVAGIAQRPAPHLARDRRRARAPCANAPPAAACTGPPPPSRTCSSGPARGAGAVLRCRLDKSAYRGVR